MQSLRLGRVSVNPRGAYDPAAEYERLDMVGYEDQGYIALRHSQGVTPKDGEDWMLLVGSGSAILAQSWAVGGTGTRDHEETDNAKFYAELAQSISQGALGWYPDYGSLKAAHETGTNGQWAIIGETDTIWTWDSDSGDWKDSHQATDLSNYYTKEQTEEKFTAISKETEEKLTGLHDTITQETDGKLAKKLNETDTAVAADKLATPKNINGVPFDGTEEITVYDNTKLPLTGGTMTGNLMFDGDSRAIKFNGTNSKNMSPIRFYDGINYGMGIVIGDGGRLIIGAGESPNNLRTELNAAGGNDYDEETHIISDGSIYLHTGADSVSRRKTVTIDGAGKIIAPGGFEGTQPKHKALALNLAVDTWTEENTYTITATGVTASNTVIVCPAPDSYEAWGESGVRCTAQGADSLTFTATDKPTVALTANVLILD